MHSGAVVVVVVLPPCCARQSGSPGQRSWDNLASLRRSTDPGQDYRRESWKGTFLGFWQT
jgi:hypothetical protein